MVAKIHFGSSRIARSATGGADGISRLRVYTKSGVGVGCQQKAACSLSQLQPISYSCCDHCRKLLGLLHKGVCPHLTRGHRRQVSGVQGNPRSLDIAFCNPVLCNGGVNPNRSSHSQVRLHPSESMLDHDTGFPVQEVGGRHIQLRLRCPVVHREVQHKG